MPFEVRTVLREDANPQSFTFRDPCPQSESFRRFKLVFSKKIQTKATTTGQLHCTLHLLNKNTLQCLRLYSFFFAHARLVLSKRVSTTKTTTLQSLSLCLGWCLYGLPANAKLTGGEENIKAASPQSGDDDVGRCESENRNRVGLG